MLSQEQNTFLRILSDYLQGRKTATDITASINTDILRQLSVDQQTEAIVYYQTHIQSLKPSFLSNTYFAVNRRKLLEQIRDVFCKAQIPYLIFKGTEISCYYPNPEFRKMGDVDILVHAEDKEKAEGELLKLGFRENAEKKAQDLEWVFYKNDFEIELHHQLLYNADFNEAQHIAFCDRAWEYATLEDGIQYHLKPEFHFVFLILHLRKHFLWAGVGIRQFMDLAVMMKNADLDWNKVEKYLIDLELLPFAQKCFALIERWFEITPPIASEQITDEFYSSVTQTILSDGVFGRRDEESMENNKVLNTTRKHGKILPMLSVIFPPYSQMKEKYPKMGRYPVLLPVMWIRRMIESVVFKRAGASMSYATKHLAMNDEMKARNEMLKSLGLLKN